MGFGKIKRLIRKSPKSTVNKDDNKPTQTKSTTNEVAAINDPAAVVVDDKREPSDEAQSTQVNTKESSQQRHTTTSNADEVLDGILQDLNVKVGQLAVNANVENSDTVSEYSGGSAKSVESLSSKESDETEEEVAEDEEETKEKSTTAKKDTVDRFDVVAAAAEKIRKRKLEKEGEKGGRSSSPAEDTIETEPASDDSKAVDSKSPTVPIQHTIVKEEEGIEKEVETPAPQATARSSEPVVASEGEETKKEEKQPKRGTRAYAIKKAKAALQASKAASKAAFTEAKRLSPVTIQVTKNVRSSSPVVQQTTPAVQMTQLTETPRSVSPVVVQTQSIPEEDKPTINDLAINNTKESTTLGGGGTTSGEVTDETSFPGGDGDENGTFTDLETLGTDDIGTKSTLSMNSEGADSTLFDDTSMTDGGSGNRKNKKTIINKDIIIHAPGGPSSLVVRAMYYTPLPGNPDDIIIKVEASSVSFRDCLLRRGVGIDKVPFPFVPGCEVVGTISNVGKAARAEGYRIGDRVVGMSRSGGGNGYYAKFNTSNVAPIISSAIDAADAVCLVDVYMTAYQALRIGKKDGTPLTEANVLITDGWSPVGQAAVALAKLEGANVYVTTTESRHDEYMKTLDVKCLPLNPSKWLPKLKGKMDVVIDNTCFDTYDSSWKALNPNGVLICTGMTSIYSFKDHIGGAGCGGCDALGDFRDYHAKWATMKARYMMSQTKYLDLYESLQKEPKKYQQELKYLCHLVESGALKPKISERVNIEEVPNAQRYLETRKS